MKRLLAILVLALAACASPPPQAADPFENSAGKTLQEITLARQALTQLYTAGKVTRAQDDLAQAVLSDFRKRIEDAQALRLTDPAQASRLLADILNDWTKYAGAKQ